MDDLISRQVAIDAIEKAMCEVIRHLPSVQPETKPIGYQECANAMLKMWVDYVVTDGEYSRIMDKLNSYWRKNDERLNQPTGGD